MRLGRTTTTPAPRPPSTHEGDPRQLPPQRLKDTLVAAATIVWSVAWLPLAISAAQNSYQIFAIATAVALAAVQGTNRASSSTQ